MTDKRAKRWKRENRASKKDGSWYCAKCDSRHAKNERCPIPRRADFYGYTLNAIIPRML